MYIVDEHKEFFLPLKIDDTEVPKYTVLLGKFHIHALGMSMG